MADAPDYSGWFRRDAFNKFGSTGEIVGAGVGWYTLVTHTVPATYSALCIAQWYGSIMSGTDGIAEFKIEVDGVQVFPSDATVKEVVFPPGGTVPETFTDQLFGYIVVLAGQVVRIRGRMTINATITLDGELWGFYI